MRRFAGILVLALGMAFAANAAERFDAAKVQKLMEDSLPAFLADHKAIVEIESSTGDVEGSRQMADWLKPRFEELGYAVEYRPNDKGTHVIATKKGAGALRVLILGHTDIVPVRGSLAKQPYAYDEATGLAKGPGVGDSKASVSMLTQFARALETLGFDNYADMTFYFDAEEETGSATEDEILAELAQKHDFTLSVDSAPLNWGMNTEKKWVVNYELNVEGLTAHAGSRPYVGASATVELANQITRIMRLASPLPEDPWNYTVAALEKRGVVDIGQFLPNISINFGSVSTTNTKVNAVPMDAYAKLEVRGFTTADREMIDVEIKKIAATPTVPGTKVTVTGPTNYMPAMEKTPEAAKLVQAYKDFAKSLYGADVTEWKAGGVSIGNFTSNYIPTIDGLGVETVASHDLENERARVYTYVPRAVTMLMLLDRVTAENIIEPQK